MLGGCGMIESGLSKTEADKAQLLVCAIPEGEKSAL